MIMYKVLLGTKKSDIGLKIERVFARSAEEACNKAMRMHKNMRYATARMVKL